MAAVMEEERQLSVTMSKLDVEEEGDKCAELQDHLLYSIMLYLPLETLLRFCCLSKYWRDIIRSRSFNLDRRELVPSVGNVVFCFADPKKNLQSSARIHRIWGNEDHPQESLDVEVPFLNDGHMSCDGLVCIIQKSGGGSSHRIVLWNPYARQSRSVSWPEAFKDCYNESFFVGFGYDTSIRGYKIVVMKSPLTDSSKWQIQVTDLKQINSWREVEISNSSSPLPHNLVHKGYSIRSLEVSQELSTQTLNPKLVEFGLCGRQRRVQLGHKNNKILYLYYYNAFPDHKLGSAIIEVWKYSKEVANEPFTKVLSISEAANHHNEDNGLIKPLGFTDEGYFIMTCLHNNALTAYIPQQDKIEFLDDYFFGANDPMAWGVAFVDMENAVLP